MVEDQSSHIVVVTPTPRKRDGDDDLSAELKDDNNSFPATKQIPETSYDELCAMLQNESNHYRRPKNYLDLESCRDGVNEIWRRRLCEWMFEVTDHYDFDRHVVSIALDYLDRSISLSYGWTRTGGKTYKNLTKRDYQLYAVTSLYLAIKIHGEMDPGSEYECESKSETKSVRSKLRIQHFTELSRFLFDAETIEKKEREILFLFAWRVNPPTCSQYLSSFLRLVPELDTNEYECENSRDDIVHQIFDVAKYLTELSVFVSNFSFTYNPSLIAYSAILCALDYIEGSTDQGEQVISRNFQIRFLCSMNRVSIAFNPVSEDAQHITKMLKQLAPKMFSTIKKINVLPRSVSLLEVDNTISTSETSSSAVSVAATASSSRVISPINKMSGNSVASEQDGRKFKRQKNC